MLWKTYHAPSQTWCPPQHQALQVALGQGQHPPVPILSLYWHTCVAVVTRRGVSLSMTHHVWLLYASARLFIAMARRRTSHHFNSTASPYPSLFTAFIEYPKLKGPTWIINSKSCLPTGQKSNSMSESVVQTLFELWELQSCLPSSLIWQDLSTRLLHSWGS